MPFNPVSCPLGLRYDYRATYLKSAIESWNAPDTGNDCEISFTVNVDHYVDTSGNYMCWLQAENSASRFGAWIIPAGPSDSYCNIVVTGNGTDMTAQLPYGQTSRIEVKHVGTTVYFYVDSVLIDTRPYTWYANAVHLWCDNENYSAVVTMTDLYVVSNYQRYTCGSKPGYCPVSMRYFNHPDFSAGDYSTLGGGTLTLPQIAYNAAGQLQSNPVALFANSLYSCQVRFDNSSFATIANGFDPSMGAMLYLSSGSPFAGYGFTTCNYGGGSSQYGSFELYGIYEDGYHYIVGIGGLTSNNISLISFVSIGPDKGGNLYDVSMKFTCHNNGLHRYTATHTGEFSITSSIMMGNLLLYPDFPNGATVVVADALTAGDSWLPDSCNPVNRKKKIFSTL